jgi:hypothetical protein
MHRRYHCVILLSLSISGAGCGDTSGELAGSRLATDEATEESQDELSGCAVSIDPAREIVIKDVSVVDDETRTKGLGAWTFGRVMTDLAEGRNVQTFVRTFLETWKTHQLLDNFVIPARPNIDTLVIAPWQAVSAEGQLDLDKAPLRLLAITNRLDLAGVSGHAGEGRLIFGVLGPDKTPLPFTIIFEYRLPTRAGMGPREWAREWHTLAALPLGSPQYNARLQALTDKFATAGTLAQVRTNEIALAQPWELREFRLKNGRLRPGSVELTPDLRFNGSPELADFIARNRKKIEAETHAVRPRFEGDPFLAASSLAPNPSFKWDAPGVEEDLRAKFSRNTCNGCHTGDTGTRFLHIGPRGPGQPAELSTFLAAVDIPRRVDNMKRLLCR